jgi:FeS assembly protein IscX
LALPILRRAKPNAIGHEHLAKGSYFEGTQVDCGSTDMHKRVTELPGFNGDPQKSNESKLEAIQMAWHRGMEGPARLREVLRFWFQWIVSGNDALRNLDRDLGQK